MKQIITLLLTFASMVLVAQCPPNYSSTQTQTGTCSEVAGNIFFGNFGNITLTVNGDLTINGNFTFADEVVVNGTLTVTGDLVAFSGGALVIADGGHVDVGDDFRPNSGLSSVVPVTIESGGTLSVADDYDGANFGSLEVEAGASVDIGGDYSSGFDSNTTVDGDLLVDGNFTNESGDITGGGTIDIGGTYTNDGGDDSGFTGNNGVPLPVELIYFEAVTEDQQVAISWSTASETNNEGFFIERSGDGQNFSQLDFILGNGTTNERSDYRYFDVRPIHGAAYYRYKQVDFDGQFEYGPIVRVEAGILTEQLTVSPNPASGPVRFNKEVTTFQLVNYQGRAVLNVDAPSTSTAEALLSEFLSRSSNGVYLLTTPYESVRIIKR